MDLITAIDAAHQTPWWVNLTPPAAGIAAFCLVMALMADRHPWRRRPSWGYEAIWASLLIAVIVAALTLIGCFSVAAQRANDRTAELIAQYVYDTHDLVAMSPVTVHSQSAELLAAEPDGSAVAVEITWAPPGPVLDVPVPDGWEPVTVTVTPAH